MKTIKSELTGIVRRSIRYAIQAPIHPKKQSPIANGAYEIPGAKAGTYKVIIEAKPPYKNAAKEGIMVADGKATEVPEIKLEQ